MEQPIQAIQKYFGDKIAFYFGWLEFNTIMLVPATIVGLIVLFSGYFLQMESDFVKDVCFNESIGNITICSFQNRTFKLNSKCNAIKISRLINNGMTVFYSVFICIWSGLLTQIWRRYEYTYAFEWDSIDFEKYASLLRPKVVTDGITERNQKAKHNPFTGIDEPYISFTEKAVRQLVSGAVISFMIILSLAGFTSKNLKNRLI